jgi:hypothetical protein
MRPLPQGEMRQKQQWRMPMSYNLVRSNLHLYAVLKNLEDVVKYDPEMNALALNWNLSIQFIVRKGPRAYVEFKNGMCTVAAGKIKRPSIVLFFSRRRTSTGCLTVREIPFR